MRRFKTDFCLGNGCADVTRDIEVVALLRNSLHRDSLRIPLFFLSELVGLNDLCDVLGRELILSLAFHEVLDRIDEKHIIGLLAFLEDQKAHWNTGGIEEIRGQTDDGVDMAVTGNPTAS